MSRQGLRVGVRSCHQKATREQPVQRPRGQYGDGRADEKQDHAGDDGQPPRAGIVGVLQRGAGQRRHREADSPPRSGEWDIAAEDLGRQRKEQEQAGMEQQAGEHVDRVRHADVREKSHLEGSGHDDQRGHHRGGQWVMVDDAGEDHREEHQRHHRAHGQSEQVDLVRPRHRHGAAGHS